MDSYLGLRLKLSFKDGSTASGTVNSINETSQKLSLTDVKLLTKGAKEEIGLPEMAVFASNISDVEIISSSVILSSNTSKSTNTSKSSSASKNSSTKPASKAKNVSTQSPHATPSVYANQTHTFPSGNARKTLPNEEFDFAANLARFDKASEFKKIQAEDSVPKGDRLVSINSPQRKLGIKESVLDKPAVNSSSVSSTSSVKLSNSASSVKLSSCPSSVNDEIMEKFKHLTVVGKPAGNKSSPLLVEEGTSSEDERETEEPTGVVGAVPVINGKDYEKFCADNPMICDASRTIASVNFAHHLLAELDPSKLIVLLLGVGESTAILLETFYQLCNHGKIKNTEIVAIFAAGGVGSAGKRIELSAPVKQARKKLLAQNRVKFTTSLNDIVKIQGEVVVFDALGHDGEVTANAEKGLTEWMKKMTKKPSESTLIYGVESSLLGQKCPSIQLVTFGIARDTIDPSLKVANSILYVDNGIANEVYAETFGLQSEEIFSEAFVVEIEY